MTGVPSMAQIRAQVASIRKGYPDARAIGIGLPALDEAATATAALRIDAEELPVVRCRSVLALREHLVDLPAAGPPLVVLTDLPPAELGEDLRARLAHRKLFSIDAWQLVKERFKAHYVDPRLVERHEWAGPALLDAEPEAGYPPAPSGFLDAETAWRGLFEGLMGIPRGERDPETLLVWALADEPGSAWPPCRKPCATGWWPRPGTARAARRGRFWRARGDSGAGPSPSVSWRGSCSTRTGGRTNGQPGRAASSRRCSSSTTSTRPSPARGPPPRNGWSGANSRAPRNRGNPIRRGRSRKCSPMPTTCSGLWAPRISQDGARFCGQASSSVSPVWRGN